jgi:putative addiction module component (TIGR02574 family)
MSANIRIPPEFDGAPNDQRIAFVQELWDRIARDEKSVPVPREHERIVRQRLREYRENPTPGESWSKIRDQLLAKLRGA